MSCYYGKSRSNPRPLNIPGLSRRQGSADDLDSGMPVHSRHINAECLVFPSVTKTENTPLFVSDSGHNFPAMTGSGAGPNIAIFVSHANPPGSASEYLLIHLDALPSLGNGKECAKDVAGCCRNYKETPGSWRSEDRRAGCQVPKQDFGLGQPSTGQDESDFCGGDAAVAT